MDVMVGNLVSEGCFLVVSFVNYSYSRGDCNELWILSMWPAVYERELLMNFGLLFFYSSIGK